MPTWCLQMRGGSQESRLDSVSWGVSQVNQNRKKKCAFLTRWTDQHERQHKRKKRGVLMKWLIGPLTEIEGAVQCHKYREGDDYTCSVTRCSGSLQLLCGR